MPNQSASKLLNNMEVNRIFNMKKSNLDRLQKYDEGKIPAPFSDAREAKKVQAGKNYSQIIFGTERDARKSSMLPASPGGIDVAAKDLDSRRRSQIAPND